MDKRELEFDAGIRQKLSEGSIDFDEAAWAKMEQRLTGRKGRLAVIPLWRQAAAIILLAGLGFWIYSAYFTNQTAQHPLAENDLYPGTSSEELRLGKECVRTCGDRWW